MRIAGMAVPMPPTIACSIAFQRWPFLMPMPAAIAAPQTKAIWLAPADEPLPNSATEAVSSASVPPMPMNASAALASRSSVNVRSCC